MFLALLASLSIRHGAFLLANDSSISPEEVRTLAELCGGKDAVVVVLDDDLVEPLKKGGFRSVRALNPAEVEDQLAHAKALVVDAPIKGLDRDRWQRIVGKFIEQGGSYVGLGFGATLVGDPRLDGEKTEIGLGIFDGIVVTNYYSQHRELALRNAYIGSRVQLGIGLDRGDWIVIRDGLIEKKVGNPHVILREEG